ncbi:hypothetical protein FQN57_001386 [Myotisia sp. PD_48]|nr:hypothetical protein FQN57_001386 [Myotisia sp. PD_48]
MLDENLPTFYAKPSSENPKSHSTIYSSQGGDGPQAAYSLRHLDPSLPNSRNRYAVALYDAFSAEVLYAEVLLIPKWTQPSVPPDALRANGGVPPPPEPLLPMEFVIQLYNPDQQITVRYKPKTWSSPATWAFEMPQQTFREPSKSQLDRTLNDPTISETTSRLLFNWKKDGKISRGIGCYVSGTVVDSKESSKRSKEPDITIALFNALKEITLYEPNLSRVEMEDYKGLEIVLILSAMVIRDVYFGQMKEVFHIVDPSSHPTSPVDKPMVAGAVKQPNGTAHPPPVYQQKPNGIPLQEKPPIQPPRPQQAPTIPPTDPRTQWEIDQESRLLKQQSEADTRERRRKEKEAEKRTKKLLEAEQKEAKKKQALIDKETERLKKLYGKEEGQVLLQRQHSSKPGLPPRPPPHQQVYHPHQQAPPQIHIQAPHYPPSNHQRYPSSSYPSPWNSNPNHQPQNLSTPYLPPRPHSTIGGLKPQPPSREKRGIFGFLKKEEDHTKNTLSKKRSSMF